MMNKQRALYLLDPRKLDPKRGDILPDIPLPLRVKLAQLVAEDLRAHPPTPNLRKPGAFVVDRTGLWSRLRGVVVEQRPEGPVTIEALLPHVGGGGGFMLEELANVLLGALARRRAVVEQLNAFNVLGVYFADLRGEMKNELDAIHQLAEGSH